MDRVFFHHIPKTGGSSLTAALSKKFASFEIFPWHHSRLDLFNQADLMPFRFFHGHFALFDFDYIPRPARMLTLIREPRERILSLYHYWRSFRKDAVPKYEPHHSGVAKSVGLASFLSLPNPSLRITIDNALVQAYLPYPLRGRNQTLAAAPETIVDDALQALDGMAAFGILERFDDSVTAIGASLGCRLILPEEKVRSFDSLGASSAHEKIEREALLPDCDRLLDGLTEIDRMFYARANKLFETKFAKHLAVADGNAPAATGPAIALEWGDWINFGAEYHVGGVTLTGWSAPEEWGRWSVTESPSLSIGPLRKPAGGVRLTFAARAAVFNTHPEQTFTVLLQGHPVENWSFVLGAEDEPSARVLNLPASAVNADGFIDLAFVVKQPVSPIAAGISGDPRMLGLGITCIHCECVP